MKKNILRLFVLVFGLLLVVYLLIDYRDNPPELAAVTSLRVGYVTANNDWVFNDSIPSTTRKLQVCGSMKKSNSATLLFTISDPNDKNDFIYQDEYYFELQPGDFCINLSLGDNVETGKYILWVMDARTSVAKHNIEFKNR